LPNPGREERFKSLTGQDAPVKEYLAGSEEVRQFSASVCDLVDSTIRNYHTRGFKNLMVSFGCTGGQHRSVYMAEQLATHLRGKAGVDTVVTHIELDKRKV
jgi:RNase adaptor protein for sRNA GlmZ degradation